MGRQKIQSVRFTLLMFVALTLAMSTAVESSQAQQRLDSQLERATTEYKSNLEQLLTLYEDESKRADARLAKVRELLAQGVVTRVDLAMAEDAVTKTRQKVTEAQAQLRSADVLHRALLDQSVYSSVTCDIQWPDLRGVSDPSHRARRNGEVQVRGDHRRSFVKQEYRVSL